jgi:hypothetical protein
MCFIYHIKHDVPNASVSYKLHATSSLEVEILRPLEVSFPH